MGGGVGVGGRGGGGSRPVWLDLLPGLYEGPLNRMQTPEAAHAEGWGAVGAFYYLNTYLTYFATR